MKKKNDKAIILLIFILITVVLTWILPEGMYTNGSFGKITQIRGGLYDVFYNIFSAIYYMFPDLLFVLVVGGCYGVLHKTKSYRKLVDKTAALIRDKEEIAMGILIPVMALWASITSQLLVLLAVVPFIVSVFLRNGSDKISAANAAFGGIILGFLGSTYSAYGMKYLVQATSVEMSQLIGVKFALLVVACAIYTLFVILHLRKNKDNDYTEDDLFKPEELKEAKNSKKVKVWPTVLVCAIGLIIIILGYINWVDSFGVSFFTDKFVKFKEFAKIKDVPLFFTLFGSYLGAFGTWGDLLEGSFMMILITSIVALMNKIKLNDFITLFEYGLKKVIKVAFVFMLTYSICLLASSYPWQINIINKVFGNGNFNILLLLIASFLAMTLIADYAFIGYLFSNFIAATFIEKAAEVLIVWRVGAGLALLIAPTSFILVMALTYLDIPYKDWVKYIWKTLLSLLCGVLLVLLITIVM